MSERQKVFLAFVASVMLHLLAAVLLALFGATLPQTTVAKPVPEAKPLEVTLMPPPKPEPKKMEVAAATEPTPPPKPTRSFLDSEGLAKADKPPVNAKFEMDTDSRAATEAPQTGKSEMPGQKGKDLPFTNFTSHGSSVGKASAPVLEVARAPEPITKVVKAEPKTSPAPMEEPEPDPIFQPTPVPVSTPPRALNAYAFGKPTPVPTATPIPGKQTPRPARELAMTQPISSVRTSPRQPQPGEPGYRPQREQTKIETSISNRGKSGVDAIGTPLGRYRKTLADAIGSRWYYYVNQRMDLIAVGDVHIKFFVNDKGRIEDVKILSNTANDTFGTYCLQSITEAQIPPPPPDVASKLHDGRLEVEYHFNIYPQ